jgi:L-rhamnose isomerase/sugar isomerase
MQSLPIDPQRVGEHNRSHEAALRSDYERLGEQLARRGVDLAAVRARVERLAVALPSWGVGTGGTRFARFPLAGEPRDVFEKLDDCAVVQHLGRATPTVSLHFPWDRVEDVGALRERAAALGLGWGAVNSNTFQDVAGQRLSYQFGSLTHADKAVRDQAIAHNLDCIALGRQLGARALTVWIGDGGNLPGQVDTTRAFDRYLASLQEIYQGLPSDWRVFLEHKLYEPALYSTVLADWGSSYIAACELGPKALCLVDLGHHAPTTNIEQIVARLIRFRRLGGFHFNDSKYGDDDLDTGAVNPFQLFLVFHELVDAELRGAAGFDPEYMLDQSHNVTDPIESLLESAASVQRAYAQALLVDRAALHAAQEGNDALEANRLLRSAFRTDVEPLLASIRVRAGGAADPVAAYRDAGYRAAKATERPQLAAPRAGIV